MNLPNILPSKDQRIFLRVDHLELIVWFYTPLQGPARHNQHLSCAIPCDMWSSSSNKVQDSHHWHQNCTSMPLVFLLLAIVSCTLARIDYSGHQGRKHPSALKIKQLFCQVLSIGDLNPQLVKFLSTSKLKWTVSFFMIKGGLLLGFFSIRLINISSHFNISSASR